MNWFIRGWHWLTRNPAWTELTGEEIQALNLDVARHFHHPPRHVVCLIRPREDLQAYSGQRTCEVDGLAFPPQGVILVYRPYRHVIVHELAHVYGADEPTARQLERTLVTRG